jgi:hypothetical protein
VRWGSACCSEGRCPQGRVPTRRLVGGGRRDGVFDRQLGSAPRRRPKALHHWQGASGGCQRASAVIDLSDVSEHSIQREGVPPVQVPERQRGNQEINF